jgi:hypothetical protein
LEAFDPEYMELNILYWASHGYIRWGGQGRHGIIDWYKNGEMNVIVKLTVKICMESEVYVQLPIHPIQMRLGLVLTRKKFVFPLPVMLLSLGSDRPNHSNIFCVHQFFPEHYKLLHCEIHNTITVISVPLYACTMV